MGLIKRGNSRFWYIQFQLGGQTFIKSTKTTDRRLAEQVEVQYRGQVIRSEYLGVKDRIRLRDALSQFADTKASLASARNIRRYVEKIQSSFRVDLYLDLLTDRDLELFRIRLEREQYASQTIKHIFNALRGSVGYAKRLGYKVPDLVFPKVAVSAGRIRYLSTEEESRLLRCLNPYRSVKGLAPYDERHPDLKAQMWDVHDFAVLLLDTGARYSEVSTLPWSSVCLEARTIRLWRSKVRNESVLLMTDRVFEILARRFLTRSSPYLFSNKNGGPKHYTPQSLKKAFERAGIEGASAHTLRHTHATRLIQNGMNLYEVKEVLGHSDIRTTMRYAHLESDAVSRKVKTVMDRLNQTVTHNGIDTTA